MNFYSITECRNFLEKLCKEFSLCPKYCHLQTNVNACFHHQLKECKGVCCHKESVKNYNIRVQNAINSISLSLENRVIKEQGRTDNEIGFVLILDGKYQGFGFIDKEVDKGFTQPEDYQFYIQPKKDNRDVQRILNSYLRNKEGEMKP
jgi:DNA polymerase-3 subunit epsilon